MKHYSKNNIIKEVTNNETGEIEYYKQITGFKRTAARGWNMTYNSYLHEVIQNLKGTKEIDILFWLFKQFTKTRRDVVLNQEKIAKKFDTNRTYISKIFRKFRELKVLAISRAEPRKKFYRLNPYLYIPANANAIELQDEWDILTHAPEKIKDKFEYLSYLQSDEWKTLSTTMKQKYQKCMRCGSVENLEVHHKTYDNLFYETEDDLEVLCHACHEAEHIK
jgi:5-methylcytosine-specific restriction endonuclease McrA